MLKRLQKLSDFCARSASSQSPVKPAPLDLRRGNMELALAWSLFSFVIELVLAFHWSKAPGRTNTYQGGDSGWRQKVTAHPGSHISRVRTCVPYQYP
jgi:hypothetical protein